MTLKSRIVSALACFVLALSIATGVLASDATVTLEDNPNPGAGCQAAIVAGTFDLGVWQWDGDAYVLASGDGYGWLQSSAWQDRSADPITCYLTVAGGPLVQQSDAEGNPVTDGAIINISFDLNATHQATLTIPNTTFAHTLGGIVVRMIDLGAQPAGVYEGTVTLTASSNS